MSNIYVMNTFCKEPLQVWSHQFLENEELHSGEPLRIVELDSPFPCQKISNLGGTKRAIAMASLVIWNGRVLKSRYGKIFQQGE